MIAVTEFKNYTGPIDTDAALRQVEAEAAETGKAPCISSYLQPDKMSADNFLLEEHKILWNYWDKLRRTDDIAAYDWINPAEFNKAIGYVLLMEPNESKTDFRYRVYGSRVADRFGLEMTGKWVSSFDGVQKILSISQYALSATVRRPIYSEHTFSRVEYTKTLWCRLILPMQNTNGDIDRILVGNIPVDFDIPVEVSRNSA